MKKHLFYSIIASILMVVLVSTSAMAQEPGHSVTDGEEFFTTELSAEDPEVILAEDPDDVLTEDAAFEDFEASEPYDEEVTIPDAADAERAGDEELEAPKVDGGIPELEDAAISEEMTGVSGTCGANASWEYFNGILTISGKGALYDYDGVNNRPPWYYKRSEIISVFVEDGITEIGAYAFGYLHSLKAVCLPSSLQRIGHASFCYCTDLKAVEIPSGVKFIDTSVFYGSDAIIRISFLGSAPEIKGMAFGKVTATAYYLYGNSTWTADKRQNYGGSLTWKSVSSYYDVWVCGIRVNSTNKDDILGDGGKAKYTPSSRTLTMNSPDMLQGAYMNRSKFPPISAVIYTPGDLTIRGQLTIRSRQVFDKDIYAEGNLNITDGDIVVSDIYAVEKLICKNTEMIADEIDGGNIEIASCKRVDTCYLRAIFSSITIKDSVVWVTTDSIVAYDAPFLCVASTITNSTVRAVNQAGNAISAFNLFRIRDSVLYAEGKDAGVYSLGFDIQKGNEITAEGAEGAMFGYPDVGSSDFKIVPGYVFVEPAAATVGKYGILNNGKNATRVVLRPLTSSDQAALYYKNNVAKTVTIPTMSSAQLRLKTKDGYFATANWTSGNSSIASVDSNGLVMANKYGKTKVSCNTGSTTLTCNINTLFYDVTDPNQPGYQQIYWGVDKGIIGGFGGVYFGPEQPCTRLQFAIMIWRMKGKQAVGGSLSFSDMKSLSTSSDSYKAVLWAVKNGIIKGYSDNTFRPNNNITREQIVIILWRLAGQPNATKPLTFKDTANLSKTSTSYKAIAWASEAGIVKGFSDNTFRKDENSKRNQIIIMIYRFVNR